MAEAVILAAVTNFGWVPTHDDGKFPATKPAVHDAAEEVRATLCATIQPAVGKNGKIKPDWVIVRGNLFNRSHQMFARFLTSCLRERRLGVDQTIEGGSNRHAGTQHQ